MRHIAYRRRQALVLSILTLATTAAAVVHADEPGGGSRKVLRDVVRLDDCPRVQGLGPGVRVLSLAPRGFLGVEASSLTPELRRHFGVPEDAGVLISRVVSESAAEAAGLEVGDVVTRVGEDEITTVGRLGRAVRHADGGETVEIEYWRGGERHATQATLEERERCTFDIGDTLRAIDLESLADLGDLDVEIDSEELEEALEGMKLTFDGVDWGKHFEGLKVIDFDQLEERMERLQHRLEELEIRLEQDFGENLERASQALERARDRREAADREREKADRKRQQEERERENGEPADGLF